MAENEAPERIWLTPQFADAVTVIGGGIYHANLSEKDREGCIEYVRANRAAPDAAQCQHLAERDALGEAIAAAAIKAEIIDGKHPLSGPQLIMLCHDLAAIAVSNLTMCGKRLPQAGHTCVVTGSHDEHHCEYGCCVLVAHTPDAVRQAQREEEWCSIIDQAIVERDWNITFTLSRRAVVLQISHTDDHDAEWDVDKSFPSLPRALEAAANECEAAALRAEGEKGEQ